MANGFLSALMPILSIIAAVVVVILLIVIIFKFCYKTCPPNKAMVVTGPTGASTVIGKAKLIIPIIQRVDYMSLENIQVDFTSRDEIPTRDAINVLVDAVANMAIDQDPEVLKTASSKFLGYSTKDIQEIVTPILEGNIREIISQTTLKDLIQGDKKEFAERVVENVSPNLRDMGLKLTTFNIQNFKDKNGVIDNLGIENTEQIRKDAAIAAAKAKSEIAIAQAQADKDANDAQVAAETDMASKQNELAIKKAELKKQSDIEIAKAEAAKGIEAEAQRREQEIATANANLARQEKEIDLKEREVKITERQLEAEIKKKAEAEKYAAQQSADAKLYETQRKSEAELFERQKKAEAEKFEAIQKADAQKALADAIKAQGIAEAEAAKAKGEAEAAAIKAKAEAEAEGLMKKAEAMAAYGDAAKQDMQLQALKVYFEQLPAIAKAVGEGYQNVDKIMMFGGESSKLAGDIMTNVSQVSEGLSESLGIDLKTLLAGFMGGKLASDKDVTVNVTK
ncbi:MAG: flotillin family protein [Lachnospiraceae bacterium]|nr:flotillin family protein [Lachnospiraceae bacterium]